MTWTWAEPFAGAAACALRLVGGRDLAPPVAWMGGKRRLARAILDAMGVPEEPPERVLLADAGPWGWVWPLLLEPGAAARVALVLRSWAGEHPRELWQRLASRPPAEDLHERAAQWLWLQARSASGVPIWWDGWRHVTGSGKPATDRGEDLRWPGHQAQREAWLASDGRGQPRPAGARAVGGRWEKGNEGRVQDATHGQRGAWRAADHDSGRDMAACQGKTGGWRMGEEQKKSRRGTRTLSEKGTANGRTGGMVNPATIAARIEALAEAFARVDVQVHHGGAHELGRRLWRVTTKGDQEARAFFDGHYSRQTPGSPHWLRPGFNYVLRHDDAAGRIDALWCWWRPKWESGLAGTERKDGLRVLECTVFRRTGGPIASDLVRAAEGALRWPEARIALHLDDAGPITGLVTGVSSSRTAGRRSKRALAGECFRRAGWTDLDKAPGARADVWLERPWPGPLFAYLDPPYVGATGYGWDMPRAEVLALARRWADAGAVVAVSEAKPLDLPGWHHLELTREGGKPEWLTLSRAPARVPTRQVSLFAEGA